MMKAVNTTETGSIGQIYFLKTDSRPVGKEMPRLLLWNPKTYYAHSGCGLVSVK
jgi:hypothetical protein